METLHWRVFNSEAMLQTGSCDQALANLLINLDSFLITFLSFTNFGHLLIVWIHSMNSYFISSPVRRGSSEFSSRSPLINCNQPVNLTGLMWHQTKQRECVCHSVELFPTLLIEQ